MPQLSRLMYSYTSYVSKHFGLLGLMAYLSVMLFNLIEHKLFNIHLFNSHFYWKLTQYSVNYFEFGFVKRGLIGTLFYPLSNISKLYVALLIGGFFFLILLKQIPTLLEKFIPGIDDCSKHILLSLFIVSPFGAFQMGFLPINTDIYTISLLFIGLMLLFDDRLILASIVSVIGILAHEGFFIYGTSLLIAFSLYNQSKKEQPTLSNSQILTAIGIPSTCLIILLYLYGNSDLINLSTVFGLGVDVWHRGAIQYNLKGISWKIAVLMAIWLHVVTVTFYKLNKGKLDILYYALLLQTSLFVMGWDYPRWVTFMFFTTIIIFISKIKLENWTLTHPSLLKYLAVFLIPIGPAGITNVYPFLNDILRELVRLH